MNSKEVYNQLYIVTDLNFISFCFLHVIPQSILSSFQIVASGKDLALFISQVTCFPNKLVKQGSISYVGWSLF